jgi:hypothetical protein
MTGDEADASVRRFGAASSVRYRALPCTRGRRSAMVQAINLDAWLPQCGCVADRDEVQMTTLMELQRAIDVGMRGGESFSSVEDRIIEPSQLSDEAKSALWLYGWSFVDLLDQRREAGAHIAQIVARPA